MKRSAFAAMLLFVLHAASASAHHSFAAEYDGKKPTTESGTITKVEWTNPHVHFFMDIKDAAGATTPWEVTIGAGNGLFRRGGVEEMVQTGGSLTVGRFLSR